MLRRSRWTYVIGALLLAMGNTYAGGKISIDETKWISLGATARTSFTTIEDAAPNGSDWSNDFNRDNARIYLNGQIHEKIKFKLNTECVFCGTYRISGSYLGNTA